MAQPIDLRSDTVTRPTPAMRRAMADAEVGDDVLDGDPTVRALEDRVASLLGKESALFFPSGTMANQTGVWLLSRRGTEVLLDAEAHLIHWEIAALAGLCGVQPRPLRGTGTVYDADALRAGIRPASPNAPQASLVCVENTHNGAGGKVTTLDGLRAIRDVAREHSLPVHMDGARLWNAAVATETNIADFAACADTVMVSFSKGLGAPVGAALAGSREAMRDAWQTRKRFGGGMRQSGILAAAALFGVREHWPRMHEDHERAAKLARAVDGAGGAKVVPPDTNIVMIDLPARITASELSARCAAEGVRISPWNATRVRAVTHLDVDDADIARAGEVIVRALER
ncbi:MAG: aminotransferase class I/II-fold pyridoxal phosphate-dependent enzyme [Gemmatimonadaceae bacterium]|nr:aminotransferase class I/II-fold pyridoxal phosphate-dependent enzyme [Gemmatimonadaceae bacterium]NUQ93927.1 aminotransferase class I/II-fold pyridoxal phosphate-dependent enzyme [Gemmatimonadaceae bacterium]NUR19646.1 aminotransferase class I/II-fold pyridoxal phosphate-dependent enzyme [Gemmatimonadaceae bacterium]NUS98011.1 aminotransferase class I/II-fold pyridoxal phosphate-dependent enzyme [Gemmatimonadaceae bacterium]